VLLVIAADAASMTRALLMDATHARRAVITGNCREPERARRLSLHNELGIAIAGFSTIAAATGSMLEVHATWAASATWRPS
jgi:hypothetical protein